MTASSTIVLNVRHIIPSAGDNETGWILSLWEGAGRFLQAFAFRSDDPYRAAVTEYQVAVHLDAVVELMRAAQASHGSFASYLQAAQEQGLPTAVDIPMTFQGASGHLDSYSLYNAAGTLIHHLMLAFNLALPGACQFVDTCYAGPESGRFEAPCFSAELFTNAWLSAFDASWPVLKPIQFRQVWQWLATHRISETDVAVSNICKVLFGPLDIAQHRRVSRHRDGLLVAHMIELLMKAPDGNVPLIRERVSAVLGKPTDQADSFNELYRLKDSLMRGDYPVRRPALIVHEADDPVLQQLEMHNSPVEQGAAIVLALIQDLINHDAAEYRFSQQVSRA